MTPITKCILSCLFVVGMARYLAVFDADEFFLPQAAHTTYRSVLSHLAPSHIIPEPSSYPPTTLEKMEQEFSLHKGGGRGMGWADRDGHPYCYFAVESYILTKQRRNYVVDPHHPWIGVRYPHGPEPINDQSTRRFRYSRIIIPTDRIYQATFNLAGACKLPPAWTTCYEPNRPYSTEVLGPRAAGMLTNQQQKELVRGHEHPQLQTFDFKSNAPKRNPVRDVTGYTEVDPHSGNWWLVTGAEFCNTDEIRPTSFLIYPSPLLPFLVRSHASRLTSFLIPSSRSPSHPPSPSALLSIQSFASPMKFDLPPFSYTPLHFSPFSYAPTHPVSPPFSYPLPSPPPLYSISSLQSFALPTRLVPPPNSDKAVAP